MPRSAIVHATILTLLSMIESHTHGLTRVVLTSFPTQLIGIVIVAEPALPKGKRFCRAMRSAVASPPEA